MPALLILAGGIWRTLPAKFHSRMSDPHRNALTSLTAIAACAYAVIMLYFHYYVWIGVGAA